MGDIKSGGGWRAIGYALKVARRAGGFFKFYRALRSRNACKTCALGMGGQHGGMVDERGRFPEVCKKSMQAMAADMQPAVPRGFFAKNGFAAMRRMTPRELEHAGRLADPLYAGPGDAGYQPIAWEEAIERSARWLKTTPPDDNFFYVSGRSSNEAGFLLQLFGRLYGTNNINNCSYYCHQASGVGLASALGGGTATIVLEDLEKCDLVFLIGGNPASNHPRLMRQLMSLRRRGGQVIVVNPLREMGLVNFSVPSDLRSLLLTSEIAALYLQPHIGGDIALLCGIGKRLLELGRVDDVFIAAHTEDWQALREQLVELSWERIEAESGVARTRIEEAAQAYAAAKNAVFAWTMGITHHKHGTDNVRAIVNLALMRGMVGKPGSGLLPIRGHSNVQGIGSVGVAPALKDAVFERLQSHFGVALPTTKGLDTLGCLRAAHEGRLRRAWCLGGNLFGATPDAAWAAEAFARLDSAVYMNTSLNTGHAQGRAKETLILPMRARDEESQATTQESMFNYVRLSDGGPARLKGPRSEVEVIARLAREVLGDAGPIRWRDMEQHRSIRQAIAAIVPGYEAIGLIDQMKQEFQVGGRTVHEPRFATKSGRARFHAVPVPERPALRHGKQNGKEAVSREGNSNPGSNGRAPDLMLMTIRSEGQFNTVVYEEEDLYRNQRRRDVILMNDADIRRLGLQTDDRVCVEGPAGRLEGIQVRPFDIRAGNAAMYYPEANALIAAEEDAESKTPAFKAVPVRIVAVPDAPSKPSTRESEEETSRQRTSAGHRMKAC